MSDVLTAPEFVVSDHAKERLRERVGMAEKKVEKLVVKAWRAKGPKDIKFRIRANRTEYYHNLRKNPRMTRFLMGRVYVFCYSGSRHPLPPQKTLVTVI